MLRTNQLQIGTVTIKYKTCSLIFQFPQGFQDPLSTDTQVPIQYSVCIKLIHILLYTSHHLRLLLITNRMQILCQTLLYCIV